MWFLYSLLSAILYGICNFSTKPAAKEDDALSMYKIIVPMGIGFAFFALAQHCTRESDAVSVISLLRLHPAVMLIIGGYLIAEVFYNAAFRFMEGIIATVLGETSVFFTFLILIGIYFVTGKTDGLEEGSFAVNILATAGCFVGIVLLSLFQNKAASQNISGSIKWNPLFLLLPLVGCFLDALFTMGDSLMLDSYAGVGVSEDDYLYLGSVLYAFFHGIVPYVILCIKLRRVYNPFSRENLVAIVPGISETFALIFYIKALAAEPLYSLPIIGTSPVFGVFLCRILLKEKIGWKRNVAVGIIIVCSILLGLSLGDV